MELKGRVHEIRLTPMAGDRIDKLKELGRSTAIELNCRIVFRFNSDDYVCDREGGIAKIN